MALTVSNIKTGVIGDRYMATCTITFDSSYPTGGEELTADTIFGRQTARTIEAVIPHGTWGGYTVSHSYSASTPKLLAYYGNTDAADGPNIQVPNTTDLSAVTGRVTVIAY